jgi:hypothetical protein
MTTTARLERDTFEFSRAAEYFDVRELQTMTGQPAERFPDVILKELLDNGADAAESAGVAPRLSVRLLRRGGLIYLVVRDNGIGMDPATLGKVLNFQTRTSDKAPYRAPTRGLQGNAFKTVLGIPAALGVRAPVYVEARGLRHRITAAPDPAGEIQVRHDTRDVPPRAGTLVAVPLPVERCRPTNFTRWARAFALFNPHASVRIANPAAAREHAYSDGSEPRNSYRSSVSFPGNGWRKFLPTDLTSAWWYDGAALAKLVFGHIGAVERGGRDLMLRDFVRQFRGLSGTAKAKAVCDRFPAVKRLADFRDREPDVARLLGSMRANSQPPSPDVLGQLGEGHLRQRFERWYGVKRFWYKKVAGAVGGIPYVVEAALAETANYGHLYHGVNFSPTFGDPLAGTYLPGPEFSNYGVAGFLERGHAGPGDRYLRRKRAAAFHLVCPVLEVLDKGKSRVKVPAEIAEAAGKALWAVAKDLYREEERRRKDAARQERADRQRERAAAREEWNLRQAVFEVMPEAVKNSAGDLGRVSAHTLYYHVRPLIQAYTSRELTSDYFEGTLLPAYQREVRPIPEVYYEPRGILYEPHTGVAIPLGTREVEEYTFPLWRYNKILFIEKKGLWPVFEAARLAERYDMAIVAGEGYATEACRVLFANAERGTDHELFSLHDADGHGYNIARTLREATARMPGHRVKVVDLGLHLATALGLGLSAEEYTRTKALPKALVLNELEREYFEGRHVTSKSWLCRRIELNAFTGPGLIEYTVRGLEAAGARGKVIPPDQELGISLRSGVRAAVEAQVKAEHEKSIEAEVNSRVKALEEAVRARKPGVRAEVEGVLASQPARSWDGVVFEVAREIVGKATSAEADNPA